MALLTKQDEIYPGSRRYAYRYDWTTKRAWDNPRVSTVRGYVSYVCDICAEVIPARTEYRYYPPGLDAKRAHIKCVEELKDE